MRKMNYAFILLGLLLSVCTIFLYKDGWAFINIALPYSLIILGVNKCPDRDQLLPITFFNIWISIYNFLYFVLKGMSKIDLFSVSWHTFAQFLLPYIVTILFFRKTNVKGKK